MSFVEKLDEKSLAVFSEAAKRPFSQQCVFFLNAFWTEFGSQAEYIYSVINPLFKQAEMNAQGISLIHLYELNWLWFASGHGTSRGPRAVRP